MSNMRFLKGTLILTFTGFLTRIIGFFYRIFLSHSIGAQGLGVYQLVVPLQTLVMAATSSGIHAALSRHCASQTALGNEKEARDYLILGTFFAFSLSMAVSWLVYQNAAFLAVEILKEPRTQNLIQILAFSFPLATLHSCINSFYFSQKKTGFPAATQLLEQVTRVGGCYLLYLIFLSEKRELTPVIAAGGALISEVAACLVSVFAIGLNFQKHNYSPRKLTQISERTKNILEMALPHTLNRILLTLLGGIEVILIPQRLRLAGLSSVEAISIYGVFTGMALPLILFPSAITNSAAVMLMPSVAQLQALGNKKRIDYVIGRTSRYCFLLGGGCGLFFFLFGKPLGLFLFNSPTAGVYIKTMAFICPFLYLNTALTSILNGLGKASVCLFHSIVGVSIRIAFVLFAIPRLEIKGYLYGILLSELVLTLLHVAALSRIQAERPASAQ